MKSEINYLWIMPNIYGIGLHRCTLFTNCYTRWSSSLFLLSCCEGWCTQTFLQVYHSFNKVGSYLYAIAIGGEFWGQLFAPQQQRVCLTYMQRNWRRICNRWCVQGVKWGCDTGSHNDLATAFWSTPDDLLSRLFSVGHEDTKNAAIDETGFTQYSLLLYSIIYLSMLALCAGVCVPAGMFMPAVMLGAATGLAAGVQLQHMLPHYHIQPGMHSLAVLLTTAHGKL